MADKKKMSVAEILAAARRADGTGGGAAPAEPPAEETSAEPQAAASETPAAEAPAAASEPAAKPAAARPAAASGARPSVKDILAMARSGGQAGGDKPAAPAEKKEPKPAAAAAPKPAPAKKEPAEKKPAAAASGVRDTASILAAARNPNKAGPVSKAEAAAKSSPAESAKAKPGKAPLVAPPMPAKPAAAKPSAKSAAPDAERRGMLGLILGSFLGAGFTSLAATSGLWGLGTARFAFPNVLTEPPSRFKVGFPADFPPGQVADKFKAQFGVWVVNTEYQGVQQLFALRTVCTHLGCTPNWLEGEQKFKCPCHGSGFYKDGINFEGPAPRPLERYAIRLADDGQLEIDKSRVFQEEMGQWKDPSCFVLV